MSIVVQFPPPPSANKIWRSDRGRVHKSADYGKWLLDAAWAIKDGIQLRQPLKGKCAVSLSFPHLRANADLDNRIKPSLDALQKSGVVENDKQFIRILAQWAKPGATQVTAEIHEVQA